MASSYAILGTGAVGGFYGGLLARAGYEVHFLLRSDFEHVSRHGLRIDSAHGDFQLNEVNAYSKPEAMPKVDVVLVTWKATANSALSSALHHLCHAETIVLVLQNGLDVEQSAADVLGAERVLGGCCFLCSNKLGPGHIHHLDYGAIAFGEYSPSLSGRVTARMETLAEQFANAGIKIHPAENLGLVRWKKLVWNIPFNGLSVILGADTRQIMNDPQARQLAEDLMNEVCTAAAANQIEIPYSHVEKMLHDTQKMVPYASSMLLDFRGRRPIEVEAIFGNTVRRASAAGYIPSKTEMLYQQLSTVDRLNRMQA